MSAADDDDHRLAVIRPEVDRPEVDRPEVVAELWAAFEAYETALVAGDLETLGASFADGEEVIRYGIADRQHGAVELARWRAAQPPLPAGRQLSETVVTTYGSDVGVVNTCFSYPGRSVLGRQSQTWLRVGGSWRIVVAHVSEVPLAERSGVGSPTGRDDLTGRSNREYNSGRWNSD